MDAFELGIADGIEKTAKAGILKRTVRRIGQAVGIKKNVQTPISQLPIAPKPVRTAMGPNSVSSAATPMAQIKAPPPGTAVTATGKSATPPAPSPAAEAGKGMGIKKKLMIGGGLFGAGAIGGGAVGGGGQPQPQIPMGY